MTKRLIGSMGELVGTVESIARSYAPDVRATGTAEGITTPNGSSQPQDRLPDTRVPTFSALITERRLEGGGAITSDTQVIPAGTRVEYKAALFGLDTETDWVLADNDVLRQLPRYAAPVDGRCEVSRWPDGSNGVTVALLLLQGEVGRGASCPPPA
jgi:hypothetical protein